MLLGTMLISQLLTVVTFSEQENYKALQRNDLIAKYNNAIKNSTNDAEKKNAVQKDDEYMEQEVAQNKIKAKICLIVLSSYLTAPLP